MNEERKIGFVYTIEHIGVDGKIKSVEMVKNLIPTVGLNYILDSAIKSASQYPSWYIGLFTANRTPIAGDDMTSFIGDCVESAAYGETSRSLAVFPSVSSGALTTSASPNVFTFDTDATITGGFLTSGVTINSNAGLLISAVKFSSPKVIAAGELLRVPVGIALATI